ncbi:MAG: transposase [Acidobacteria bacterium]|nr:transposase [Acidobacteriota bacterium]
MSRFLPYNPEQAYLLPPSVKEELGGDHLCFFIHGVVERLDLREFERAYSDEGGALYHPGLMLKLWLYAYAVGLTSARRLEQRVKEDLALRYLAGGARPDHWALSAFRRRHGRGLNDAFTQVLEWIRERGGARLGRVVIDSTRIRAWASRDRIDTEQRLRNERARLRRQVRQWQKACDAADPEEGSGMQVALAEAERRLEEMPRRLQRLRKSGLRKLSPTDPEARFLRERSGFVLGYTGEVAVSDDHFIVAQRVTQNASDTHALLPMVEEVERQCSSPPVQVLADAGFFSLENVSEMVQRGIDAYVPDSNLARELNTGQRCPAHNRPRHAVQRRMRQKLRSPAGRALYARRKAVVEPVLGTLKQQRGMRQFRTRGLASVGVEFALAAVAYNLSHLFQGLRA